MPISGQNLKGLVGYCFLTSGYTHLVKRLLKESHAPILELLPFPRQPKKASHLSFPSQSLSSLPVWQEETHYFPICTHEHNL
jgi:hypothetical protein